MYIIFSSTSLNSLKYFLPEYMDYYILKNSTGVAVIVECGFLSNPQEAQLLVTKEYQTKVAEAIAEGIIKYLEAKWG